MGYSLGGASTMLAAYESIAASSSNNNLRFSLHIAFYAPCIIQPEVTQTTGAPFVGFGGMEDECTPKSRCDKILNVFETGDTIVQSKWYEGAAHGWNGTKPVKFYEGVPNFAPCEYVIHENGQVTEAKAGLTSGTDKQIIENSEHCVDFGYSIGRHDKTDELTNTALLEAINRHLKNVD